MIQPFAVILDLGNEKIPGYVMKMTVRGLLIEVERIPFKVGTFVNVIMDFGSGVPTSEKVRTIKHYDRFFRRMPKKVAKKTEGSTDNEPVPKKLVECHFVKLTELTRVAISRYLMEQQTMSKSQAKKSK